MSSITVAASHALVTKYMWIQKDVRKPTMIKMIQDEDIEHDRYNHNSKKEKKHIQCVKMIR